MAVKIAQMDFFLKQITKKINGIAYAFDKYLSMKGDSEELNKLITEEINKNKQEPKGVESNRNDSKGSKPK
tara:strand:+ start:5380 stop:5592 length:213 start_codon:yes stop_codon:yes gene_type:complete